jgi:hypothetical protein
VAWSSISGNCELSVCIEDEGLNREAGALFWERWKLATGPAPNIWEPATPLALPFVP